MELIFSIQSEDVVEIKDMFFGYSELRPTLLSIKICDNSKMK